jgi:RNA recognition motif-containing protein
MQIFVGNLPTKFTDDELKSLFTEFGSVRAAAIGRDKKTGEPAGYGIVEMPVKSEMRAAVDALRGKKLEGKALLVRPLKPDDPFHGSVIPVTGQAAKTGGNFRGDASYRATGAIRRGGQRGS